MRTRVEPKTFFANERTFLQWLQIRWGSGGQGRRPATQGSTFIELRRCGASKGSAAVQSAARCRALLCGVLATLIRLPGMLPPRSVLILMTATSMLSGTGLLGGLAGGGGGAAATCDATDTACFASKVGAGMRGPSARACGAFT